MMQRICWNELLYDAELWEKFQAGMRAGDICALETDTLYGLAVDGDNFVAVKRLYEIKNRENKKPFILLLAKFEMLAEMGVVCSAQMNNLLIKAWLGALTVIFPKPKGVVSAFELPTLGVRVPNHVHLQSCLKKYQGYLLSTSANRAGVRALGTPDEIEEEFGNEIEWLIEGDGLGSQVGSTVIDSALWPPRVLRQGTYRVPKIDL